MDEAIKKFKIEKWLGKNIRFHNKKELIDAIMYHKFKRVF